MTKKAQLILSDGQVFEGRLIGAPLKTSGELVFTTGMVGYSESLTDPSYFGQILVFTYPLIGNYGIPPLPSNREDVLPRGFESYQVNASAAIVTTDSLEAYHWKSYESLDKWLLAQNVPGIAGLDTRALVHIIREKKGILGRIEMEGARGVREYPQSQNIRLADYEFFNPSEHEILPEVSTTTRRILGKGKARVGLIDCGVKWNIVRHLLQNDIEVELLPWNTRLQDVDCSGWLISNGPGDPEKTGDLIGRVKTLLDQGKPILGICLGHQILSLAAGAKSLKMDYGHRSHNQPVYLCGERKGFITSQNHGYVIDEKSLVEPWQVWFRNANDHTIEGIKHQSLPIRSVQFHPEAAGGPRDTAWILDSFVSEVKSRCHS